MKHVAIELGHVFQLGLKYSSAQQALFLDEDGKQKPIVMGCYGIGVSRLIAAVIETNNDVNGIIWPKEVAPFDIEILPLQVADQETMDLARQYCRDLEQAGFAVLVDDRDESAGRKFNDADLIGIPQRITIGKRTLKEGKVEIKNRRTGETFVVLKENAVAKIRDFYRADFMLSDMTSQVESIVLPLITEAGLELVDLIIVERNATYMIEVLADRPQGGITLEECAAINKRIVEVLDRTQPWAEDYELTVASPGLDRLLKNQKDFARMLGQRVKFLLTEK